MSEKLVYPFSNGSQFMDWEARNCSRCVKRCRDQLSTESPCQIENMIWQSQLGSGGFTPEDAARLGYTPEKATAYTWKCPGFDDDPGVWCAHCLHPIETEDALFISERCDHCGGSLADPRNVLDKGAMLEKQARDHKAWDDAIAVGLIVPRSGEAGQ